MQTLSMDNNRQRNHAIANALMSMFEVMDTEAQLALLKRLSTFMARKTDATTSVNEMSVEEAKSYLDKLVVRGGSPVPADESSMDAWMESKYM